MRTTIIESSGPGRTCKSSRALFVLLFAAAACSITPPLSNGGTSYRDLVVQYDLRGGMRPIRLPVSDPSLTIQEMRIVPAQEILHRDGERWLLPTPGIAEVTVYARYRLWPRSDGVLRDAGLLFPGADRIVDRH